MANNKDIENDWSYKIGYIIGGLISNFFIFLWDGLKASFKINSWLFYTLVLFCLLDFLTLSLMTFQR